MERTDREPCPFRIVDDAGGAFLFGTCAKYFVIMILKRMEIFV